MKKLWISSRHFDWHDLMSNVTYPARTAEVNTFREKVIPCKMEEFGAQSDQHSLLCYTFARPCITFLGCLIRHSWEQEIDVYKIYSSIVLP